MPTPLPLSPAQTPTPSPIIDPDGPFDRACTKLIATGFALTWQDPFAPLAGAGRNGTTRAKFTCPGCGLNAWARPGAGLGCTDCGVKMKRRR